MLPETWLPTCTLITGIERARGGDDLRERPVYDRRGFDIRISVLAMFFQYVYP